MMIVNRFGVASHTRPRVRPRHLPSLTWVAVVACCAVACGDPAPAPQPARLDSGPYAIEVAPGSSSITLWRGAEALLVLPPDGLQLGRVDQVSDGVSYDPWPLISEDPIYEPPPGLRWLQITKAQVTRSGPTEIEATLTFTEGVTASLAVELGAEGSFRLTLTPDPTAAGLAYLRLRPRVDGAEAFYGLGGQLDDVNLRGRLKAMQLEVHESLEGGYNEAHVPVPFLIGTRGWGLFVESAYPGAFDVAATTDDRVEATFGTGLATGDGLVFHLFAAQHPLDITRRYYDVTGDPLLPARWALGPLLWRDENEDQAQVVRDATTIRALDLAITALWIDRPYASAVNSFDFDPAKFADPDAMIATLHDLGFRVSLWHTPYLDEDDPEVADLVAHAEAEGYYPPVTGIRFNHWGDLLDLTNPAAFAWWQELIRRYTDRGIEGFKLDYAEDVVPGIWGARNEWLFADGSDERTMHSGYQLLYHRVYAETLPAEGGFLLCRGGTYGSQRYASVIWPGDLDASFDHHGDEAEDRQGSPYVAVGGLPASVIYGLTLGPSGFPFFGADTGGYRHSPPDKELFIRWFEQTALSSVMQVGTSSNDVPWEPTSENGFDAEVLDLFRVYARLHLRLFPYAWTYATRLAVDGRPLQRPFGLQEPGLGLHPSDQYFFGDDLLVAPVLARDARARAVQFPPGLWIDWWTGEAHHGPAEVEVPAPLGILPLFQRAGSVVPLLRPTIDTTSPVADPGQVDSYDTDPGVLYPRVAPGPASLFVLYDGSEVGQALADDGVITLTWRDGNELDQGALFTVVGFGPSAPSAVTLDGASLGQAADLAALEALPSGYAHDPADAGWLHVKVLAGPQRQALITP